VTKLAVDPLYGGNVVFIPMASVTYHPRMLKVTYIQNIYKN